MRDLFKRARENTPAVIWIDEIDATPQRSSQCVGARRARVHAGTAQRDGRLRAKLGILVLAATNRGDMLDDALLRPGRFDRRPGGAPRPRRAVRFWMCTASMELADADLDRVADETVGTAERSSPTCSTRRRSARCGATTRPSRAQTWQTPWIASAGRRERRRRAPEATPRRGARGGARGRGSLAEGYDALLEGDDRAALLGGIYALPPGRGADPHQGVPENDADGAPGGAGAEELVLPSWAPAMTRAACRAGATDGRRIGMGTRLWASIDAAAQEVDAQVADLVEEAQTAAISLLTRLMVGCAASPTPSALARKWTRTKCKRFCREGLC